MSRVKSIAFVTLFAAGCSEYAVTQDSVNAGPAEVTGEQTDTSGTTSGGEWEDETDPTGSGGGSGAVRPDDPVDPPEDTDGDDPGDADEPEEPEEPVEPEEPEGDPPAVSNGRMTGGGSVWYGDMRVTHGLTLRCDPSANSNNLQINWGPGERFHLDYLIEVDCYDDPDLHPGMPASGFDTLWALGVGVDGTEIELLLTDDGEPGTTDEGHFLITDGEEVLLDVGSMLDRGNHQAHGQPNVPSDDADDADTAARARQGCTTTGGAPWAAGAWVALLLLASRRR